MKRPWFPFYPADWTSNGNLRRCSHAEKGVWIDLMCLMHDSEEYGVLRWTLKEIANAIGCKQSDLNGLIDKGVLKGGDKGKPVAALTYTPVSGRKRGPTVTLVSEQNGPVWYSSRMVEDEYKRIQRGGLEDAPNNSPKGGNGAAFDAHQSRHHPRARLSESESYTDKTPVVSNSGDNDESVINTNPSVVVDQDQITQRAIQFTAMLRQRGANLHASHPLVREWAEQGITDQQVLSSMDIALQNRAEASSTQPIGASYLDTIIKGGRKPAAAPARGKPTQDDVRAHNRAVVDALMQGEGAP